MMNHIRSENQLDRGRPISEGRLMEIRREGESRVQRVPGADSISAGLSARADAESGYYGLPLLKPPRWKWEVPAYLFTGGAAGASAVIAAMARLSGTDPLLARDAQHLATAGALVSPILLSSDLGRPTRFLNMLRVFKPQSPMSVGTWILTGFSASSTAVSVLDLRSNHSRAGDKGLAIVQHATLGFAALMGLGLSTYTGVLIGATAIPVWHENVGMLPYHFGASALGSAVGLLELAGHQASKPLGLLGIGAACAETVAGARIEIKSDRALKPLKSGKSGWLTRLGGLLSGPVPLVLRLLAGRRSSSNNQKLRRIAAASCVAGAVLTRAAWISAGSASTKDAAVSLGLANRSSK
ncbi:MAG TPA: NrfD/PsrC family molybdoenzyme membrane anchor subunit [Terriglobia bacterium]|nr:NrfD/PsrC family molybdoenzyme membrane anchor subunit [Terriglobia bacterium]